MTSQVVVVVVSGGTMHGWAIVLVSVWVGSIGVASIWVGSIGVASVWVGTIGVASRCVGSIVVVCQGGISGLGMHLLEPHCVSGVQGTSKSQNFRKHLLIIKICGSVLFEPKLISKFKT